MTYTEQTKAVLKRLKGNERDLKEQSKDLEKLFLKWHKNFDKFMLTIRQ